MLLLWMCRVCSAVLLEAGDTIGVGVAVEGLKLEGRRGMEMWGDGLGPPSEVEGLQAWREGGGGEEVEVEVPLSQRRPPRVQERGGGHSGRGGAGPDGREVVGLLECGEGITVSGF